MQIKSTKVIDRGFDDNMAAKLSSFSPHPSILSPLLKKASDTVPPTDELERLQDELRLAKEKALERSRKANDDLKTIEESIRRMTEREKGKFKATDKIKRERDCTYMLINHFVKERNLTCGLVRAYLDFRQPEYAQRSRPVSMQTPPFPMHPTPKAQALSTDNH